MVGRVFVSSLRCFVFVFVFFCRDLPTMAVSPQKDARPFVFVFFFLSFLEENRLITPGCRIGSYVRTFIQTLVYVTRGMTKPAKCWLISDLIDFAVENWPIFRVELGELYSRYGRRVITAGWAIPASVRLPLDGCLFILLKS